MKIATRLKIATSAPVLMAFVSVIALGVSNHALNNAQERIQKVRDAISSVNNLNSLVYSYMLRHEERPKQQFLAEHDAISHLLSSIEFQDPEQRRLLDRLRTDVKSMKGLFVKMAHNYERLGVGSDDVTVKEAGERLGGQLLSASSQTVSDGLVLAKSATDSATANERRLYQLVFFLILSMTIIITYSVARLMKEVSISLARLSKGADIIGLGNLDYSIGITTRDELGDVARSFDLMATRLAESLAGLQRREEELRHSETRLRLAIEATRLGTFDFNPLTGELLWSDLAKEHFGLSANAEVKYDVFLAGLHPDDRDKIDKIVQKALHPESGGTYSAEYRTIGIEDGKERWLSASGQTFFDEAGRPVRLIGATLDITDRKRTEALLRKARDEFEVRVQERTAELSQALHDLQMETEGKIRAVEEVRLREQMLIQQSRLAAMGEMLVNISHQWRQPLNVLGLKIQELGLSYEYGNFSDKLLNDNIESAMGIIKHMSQTINDFQNFLSPNKEKTTFRLNEVIASTVGLVQEYFNSQGISIDIEPGGEPEITGYANEFGQALLNLLNNAKDALLERGTNDPRITVRSWQEKRAVVTVTDNAGGIRDEILDRIFDAYFTTKALGKGTGVGLFMSKVIIEQNMGGRLSVRNTRDGAEFKIEV